MIRRLLAASAAFLFSVNALAFDPYPDFKFNPASGALTVETMAGNVASWAQAGKTASAAGVEATMVRTAPFVPPTSGTFRMLFTPANIGKAVVSGAGVALSLVAMPVASGLLNAACVRGLGGSMVLAPGGQWEECHFTNQTVPQWAGKNNVGSVIGPWRNTYQDAAKDVEDWYNTNNANVCSPKAVFTLGTVTSTAWSITKTCNGVSSYDWYRGGYSTQNATQQVQDGWVSATPARAETLITNQAQLWTQGDAVAKQKLIDSMGEIQAQGQGIPGALETPTLPSVTEPAINVVKSTPTGSTTESTTTKHDYGCTVITGGQALSCTDTKTQTTTSSTVDSSTGTTTTATTTTTSVTDPQKSDSTAFSDVPLPDVPTLYTRKYPDGLVGVWNTRKAELSSSPLLSLVHTIMPNIGDGGSCPSFNVDLDVGIANFGVQQVQAPCWLWPILKIIVLCSALLLARALIFGG